MIVKNKDAILKMRTAGRLLASIFEKMKPIVVAGSSTAAIDSWIGQELKKSEMISQSLGYQGYQHVSCISVNSVIVHGVPAVDVLLKSGDIVTVDVCAAWRGYCADMARCFVIGTASPAAQRLIDCTQQALDRGIEAAVAGNRLFDISHAIQQTIEAAGFGIVKDFAGHGIGARMHESPDLPNYGVAGTGMRLKAGMTFAIEPMVTAGSERVKVDGDGWTARTQDGSLAAHIEDTVLITEDGPEILTRLSEKVIEK